MWSSFHSLRTFFVYTQTSCLGFEAKYCIRGGAYNNGKCGFRLKKQPSEKKVEAVAISLLRAPPRIPGHKFKLYGIDTCPSHQNLPYHLIREVSVTLNFVGISSEGVFSEALKLHVCGRSYEPTAVMVVVENGKSGSFGRNDAKMVNLSSIGSVVFSKKVRPETRR
ncbi:hypothetical protein YC2023_046217 [Brassica napus]